jgi:hypothetical protein
MVQTISYAVFRARVLHGMKHFGIHYDDLEICNGQGVYKGGISKLQEQLNQLSNNQSNNNSIGFVNEEAVYLYPNPAQDKITVACKGATELIVYDLLGNAVLKKKLDSKLTENKLETSILQTGMYLYKILKQNNEVFNGKLIIE